MARLGIHTRVEDIKQPGNTHAWITYVDGDNQQDYTLHPDNSQYKNDKRLSENSHVSVNANAKERPTSSLYVDISPQQEADFKSWLDTQTEQQYSYRNNNCSHWARDAWQAGTGQRLEVESSMPSIVPDKPLTVSSPVGLEKSIRELELQPEQEQNRVVSPNALKTFDFPAPASDVEQDRATRLAQIKADFLKTFERNKEKDMEQEY